MSIYAISDLHGCKQEFDELMELICFSDYDELWIIGDVCDRGKFSISLLREIMQRDNMHIICGNHDLWFIRYIDTLIKIKNGQEILTGNDMRCWLSENGGYSTAEQFMNLKLPECYDIKLYMEELPMYKELKVHGQSFLLVHAGLGSYCYPGVRISAVPDDQLVWPHIKLDDNPFPDVTMIVGHLPTFFYGQSYDGQIAHGIKRSILHIDCGCVYGRTLGCVRLDDMKEFYVPSTYPKFEAVNFDQSTPQSD